MGIFDELLGKISGAGQGSQQNQPKGLVQGVMEVLTSQETGGLQGLIQSFNQKGLGDLISSWVGTGENAPITPDQVQKGLGSDVIQQLAERSGLSIEAAKAQLAELLPGLIDSLTPEGKISEEDLLSKGRQLLQGIFSQK